MEVDVLGSPSLIAQTLIAQDLCESRGVRPGFPVPDSTYGFCGRKATPKKARLLSELTGIVRKSR